ncbi:MAG: hypothetical protein WD766_12470 [Gemmatimonadota bacterium]
MRASAVAFLVCAILPQALTAQVDRTDSIPVETPVATMSELMIRILYPASDAIFYIETRVPSDNGEWGELEAKALMLAESANLLMMPSRARGDQWMRDALLLREAGEAAYHAARNRDVEALAGLNDQLYQSCVSCHVNFRPDYGRRP